MVPKPFKKYYDGNIINFSMPNAKTITQIRLDGQKKGNREAQSQKAVILVLTPTTRVLKYLILLLQHPSKLKYF